AYNEGRAQQFEEIKDYITMYQYSAILDGRTSDICLELDKNGKGFYNANEIASINPPNHHLCRSILVPIFKDDEQPEQTAISGKLEKDQGNFWKIKK
ncbi:MAG: phage minor head protein, partial [Pseudomonadota bacterium]|nr:phage minor head protein [Pseudomonadota bacterium]